MSILFDCSCGQQLTVRDELIGTQVRCPVCRGVLTVPSLVADDEEAILCSEEQFDDVSERVGFDSDGVADVGRWNEPAGASRGMSGILGVIALRDPPTCLAYSADDRWGAAGIDVDVQVLDMRGHKRAYKIDGHDRIVTALRFSPDGQLLLSGDESGRILVWDMAEKRAIGRLKGHERKIVAIDISADGNYAASAASGGDLRAWNLETGGQVHLDETQWNTEVNCVAFAPSGLSFAAGGANGHVDVWDILTGEPLEQPPSAPMAVRSLRFSEDGKSLTGCGIGRSVTANRAWRWKVPSGASIECWKASGKGNCNELLSEVVAGGQRIVSIGEVPRKRSGYVPPSPVGGLVGIAIDGARLYQLMRESMPNDEHRVEVWNVKLGTRICSDLYKGPRPECLAVSPSGLRLMFGYGEHGKGRVSVWGIRP